LICRVDEGLSWRDDVEAVKNAPDGDVHPNCMSRLVFLSPAWNKIVILVVSGISFLVSCTAFAGTFEDDFAVVFVDTPTEDRLGPFPFDRVYLAEATEKIAAAKARAIVFKFYFQLPKTEASDLRLSQAFKKIPVVLQAQFDVNETKSNPLPSRFVLKDIRSNTLVSGQKAWIPYPALLENVADLGFVDFGTENVPMVELYQDKPVKSLVLCAVEMAVRTKAKIDPRHQITFGSRSLPLSKDDEVKVTLPDPAKINAISFHKIIDGTVPQSELEGKVVIIGYDGVNMHSWVTPQRGPVKEHRLFVTCVKGVYDLLNTPTNP
jgi:CHASE2 domain-containing sensor protein